MAENKQKKDRPPVRVSPEMKMLIEAEASRLRLFEYEVIDRMWKAYKDGAPIPVPHDGSGEIGILAAELRRLADEQARLHGLIEAQVVRVVNSNEKKLLERVVALAHRRDFTKRLEAFVKHEEMAAGQEMVAREKKAG